MSEPTLNEKDAFLLVNNLYPEEPYRNIIAAAIYSAVLEARYDFTNSYDMKRCALMKKEALDFIFSDRLEVFLAIARIDIDAETIRKPLEKEQAKRAYILEIITNPKYNSPNKVARMRKNDKICLNLSETNPDKPLDMGVSG